MRCEGVGAWGAVSLPGGQKEAGDIKKKMGKWLEWPKPL